MNNEQAFEALFASVAAALNESLARHSQAALKGNLKAMEIETDLQRKLVAARNQLQSLRDAWPLPGEAQPAASQPTTRRRKKRSTRAKKLGRGKKTPQSDYVLPILQVLEEMGARGVVADVLDRVGEIMAGVLNEHDRGTLNSGDIRWRNTAQWARQRMKEQGLLASNSPTGIWEITEMGRRRLCEQKR